ncbi:MAG: endonuclease V [Sulfolobales archaeon]|nr:endonuclease V [Sulfolobales archaeon]MCX8199669.1 endonuclease V [Sulfolobales archaeon]MDW8170623.1 endonuclease V [Desulfurococcaceae archaeon]
MIDVERAKKLQKLLGERALRELDEYPDLDLSELTYVSGVDASYSRNEVIGVAVLLDARLLKLITYSTSRKKPQIPYIPGLLAFREAPAVISALIKLPEKPDLIVVDGHGLSHPRAFGIATHIGLVLKTASIGVAKKPLYGELKFIEGKELIVAHGRTVGALIKHEGTKLYVSIGYGVSLRSAVKLIECMLKPGVKLPLPIHEADGISKRLRL